MCSGVQNSIDGGNMLATVNHPCNLLLWPLELLGSSLTESGNGAEADRNEMKIT